MPAYCTVNPALTGFLLNEDEAETKYSGIINLLFGVLVAYTRGHFTTQLVKYPRVLPTITPNKIYLRSSV